MATERNINLKRIAQELAFIRRTAQNNIEGNYETVDEISLAVQSALEALDELGREVSGALPFISEHQAEQHCIVVANSKVYRLTVFEPAGA